MPAGAKHRLKIGRRDFLFAVLLLGLLHGCASDEAPPSPTVDWPAYGGTNEGQRYSQLTQINRHTVARLAPVWRFETGEKGESQTQPIVVDGVVFGFTPSLDVIALDGRTGDLLWSFTGRKQKTDFIGPARGLAMWNDGEERILFAGIIDKLFALDPGTGEPVAGFGNGGSLDLREHLPGDTGRYYISMTSPGVIYGDNIIVGFRTGENPPAAPGDIRAYDVRSGALRWSFHTIPDGQEPGAKSWPPAARKTQGGANAWAGFAVDEKRGIVYVPTGSAVPDFFGGERKGDNLYANSLIALDAETGRRLWHFQAVHHDLWDRDFPAPPSLVTVQRGGREIDAVVQTSKQGYLYLFDRTSGVPLFPITERPVPASPIPTEAASPTQPHPEEPAPFARQRLTKETLTERTAEAAEWARQAFETFVSNGQFTPFGTEQPTVVFPGFDGGAEWGGAAIDPEKAILYVNSNDVAWTGRLVRSLEDQGLAESLYEAHCAICHGIDREGSPPAYPALHNVSEKMSASETRELIRYGRGRMPGFPGLPDLAIDALSDFLRTDSKSSEPQADDKEPTASIFSEGRDVPYRFTGYKKFLDPEGYPAVAPPWGTLNAIDLNTGDYLWRIPLGEYPELAQNGVATTGTENYGGPVLTASGLLFIGATIFDRKFRAIDAANGDLLWEYELPYAGTATPAVYQIDGRQYIVINTSNARNPGAAQGSAYVAFALPEG